MSIRVVVYAEGEGELAGELRLRPRPGSRLADEHLGPAHHLVRRLLVDLRPRIPSEAILFEEPLRTNGRIARGSDLLSEAVLNRLLSWLPASRPDLCIVLVDADGEPGRRSTLMQRVSTHALPCAVGVAIQEFESWLVTDHSALTAVGLALPPFGTPEQLGRGVAKKQLSDAVKSAGLPAAEVRRALAKQISLDELEARSKSFHLLRESARDALDRAAL